MKVKLCGVTRLQDALYIAHQGAWAIGFNFYAPSPRGITYSDVQKIITQLPASLMTVGICIYKTAAEIRQLLDESGLNLVQIYDDLDLPVAYKKRCILALQAQNREELPSQQVLNEYGYLLLDAPKTSDGLMGGTGRLANWDFARLLAKDHRLILAGGLTPTRVSQAIDYVQPFAFDVASGVEISPGVKDHALITDFLQRSVRGASKP